MFIQALIAGIAVGSVYALIALGMVLIYKASSVINFSQGALVMIGAYITYAVVTGIPAPLWITIPIAIGFSALLGVVIERLIFRYMTGVDLIAVIMVTLGISFLLEGSTTAIWGTLNYSFPKILPEMSFSLGGIHISEVYIWSFIFSMVILIMFTLFFKYSKIGLRMRAVADNQKASISLGIHPGKMISLSWAISCVVATIGGVMLANIKLLNLGLSGIGILVFPVVILGGLDSIIGAVLGGFIIGILGSLSAVYAGGLMGGAVDQVVSFVILLIILLVKPYGLFGTKETLRL